MSDLHSNSQLQPAVRGDNSSVNRVLFARVRQLIDQGQVNAASLLLPTLEKRGENPGTIVALSAAIEFVKGRHARAKEIVSDGLAAFPENSIILCFSAEISLEEKNWVEAAKAASEAVVADPRNSTAKSILGRALLELGHIDDAATCLREVLDEMPSNFLALAGLCRSAPAEAEDTLRNILQDSDEEHSDRPQDDLRLRHLLISVLIERGAYTEATDQIRRLVAEGRANLDTSLLAVQAAVGTGNWDEATLLFSDNTRNLPRHA
ncbi:MULTISPECIES: lipopolysaccharide assembly protein LapB [unclassified Acidiphilium]|uniref:tetratricopeptide repeat protein n=1 Tax=unclassified Acidiphilium TaxID=2617493 RepID=UPI0002144AA2|nr:MULTISPECIES: tetratricopeptide repeat protein [unclassified Acidiphilium]EGO94355.1 TPR repeat-containing protein [Acidiphilium sp. PM]KDM68319.1 TPR repeat-containing protein [Acidiphilium sp. JA12-A1]